MNNKALTTAATGQLQQPISRHVPMWAILVACLSLFGLTACSGGIFGTGDGDGPKVVIPPEEQVDNGEQVPGEAPTVGDVEQPEDGDISFNNSAITSAGARALIRVVHAATDLNDNIVITNNGDNTNPWLSLPGLSFADAASEYKDMDASMMHDFDFYAAESFRSATPEKVAGINPLDVASDTVSTFVVRGKNTIDSPIDVITLKNIAVSGNANGMFRVIHAAPNFARQGSFDVHLLRTTDSLDAEEPTFTKPLSYESTTATGPVSGYVELVPGEYTLTGTRVGTNEELVPTSNAIELNPGQVLTVVLRDNTDEADGNSVSLLVLQDSTIR